MPRNDRDYALVVGIDDYPDYGKNGRNLKGAKADAKAFYDWLIDETAGGGVPAANCKRILSTASSPRTGDVHRAFEELWKVVKEKGGGRRFYFFFSGHGQVSTDFDDGGDTDICLCMNNWARDSEGSALSSRKYRLRIQKCLPFDELVFFFDCCSSRSVAARGAEPEKTCAQPVASIANYYIGFASEYGQQAYETGPPADEDAEPIVHGNFTKALLAALKGEAAGPSGGVAFGDLKTYLSKNVPRIARRRGEEQQPKFIQQDSGGADIVLGSARRIETADVTIKIKPSRTGEIILEDADLNVVRKGPAASGPWKETLRTNKLYMLREVGKDADKGFRPISTGGGFRVNF